MTLSLLTSLPRGILLNIFDHLDERTLLRSRLISREWKSIVDDEGLWLKKFRRLNKHNPRWLDWNSFSWKDRYYYSKKWIRGQINQCDIINFRKKYIPWLQLCPSRPKDHLWISYGSRIERISTSTLDYKRPPSKRNKSLSTSIGFASHLENDDFCRFTLSKRSPYDDGLWVAGGTRSGLLHYFYQSANKAGVASRYFQAHDSDLHCVDLLLNDSLAITGSRDRTVKIWHLPALNGNLDVGMDEQPTLKATLKLDDRAWCLKTNRQRTSGLLAVGSAACWNDCAPLTLWDIESQRITTRLGTPCKRGAGVLDLSFTSDQTILSGGYDSVVRLWDLRIGNGECVGSWEETYNSSVYCLASDNDKALFVGTSRYGLVWLLDTRWRKAVQNFYVGSENRPVYSMAATTGSLYVGLDNEIGSLQC